MWFIWIIQNQFNFYLYSNKSDKRRLKALKERSSQTWLNWLPDSSSLSECWTADELSSSSRNQESPVLSPFRIHWLATGTMTPCQSPMLSVFRAVELGLAAQHTSAKTHLVQQQHLTTKHRPSLSSNWRNNKFSFKANICNQWQNWNRIFNIVNSLFSLCSVLHRCESHSLLWGHSVLLPSLPFPVLSFRVLPSEWTHALRPMSLIVTR